jgi:hypothetical protein
MALTSTFTTNPVKSIIVNQTASTSLQGVGDNNVAGGPVYLISCTIGNSGYGTTVYTKLFNSTAAITGTDSAFCVLRGKASGIKTYVFHPPLYFDAGISVITTITAGQAGVTAPVTPPAVTLILSETAS